MKRIRVTAWLLVLVMLFSFLVSCGGNVGTTDDGTATTTKTQTGGDTPSTGGSNTGGSNSQRPSDPDDPTDGLPEEMPVFHINTDGMPITSKEIYIPGELTVSNTDDAYAMTDAEIEIRGRGNFSWSGTEKKSYRIKFAEKTNLLGQGNGPARSWTLLAVHCDQSMLRNAAAFYLARHLSGIDYASSVSFAKVYLNDEFLGVYQVSEQMQVQEYRVNIDDSGENDEIDFLVELDTQASEYPVFDGFNKYEIKSEVYTDAQYEYIQMTLSDAFMAVLGGNQQEVEELLDIDSVIDTYIVEEFMKNLDVGWGSFYMYQEVGGKLHFGPVWDFDLSAGNAEPDDRDPFFTMPQYLYVGNSQYHYDQCNRWFIFLYSQKWFQDKVAARWTEIQDEITATVAYVKAVGELYSDEFDLNFERWPIFGQRINREPWEVRQLKNHDEHVAYLVSWLEQRAAWLTKYYHGEVSGEPTGSPSDFVGSGGNGTARSPYLVSTAADFAELARCMQRGNDFGGKYILQTADIDMAGYAGYNGLGKDVTFAGTYNGNGYVINAEINGNDQCLFPYVTGTVMNLITTGSVTNTEQAAGIARSVRRGGAIINCMSLMKLTSTNQNAGGIVASNESGGGTISGCIFAGELSFANEGGAINVFVADRGGEYSYNYYLNSSRPALDRYTAGNETAFTSDEAKTLHTALNANLNKLSGNVNRADLCRWQAGDDGMPVMEHK